MKITVPGMVTMEIENLVLDYNGTIATDGKLIDGVRELINHLSGKVEVHVITADTYGTVERELEGVKCRVVVIGKENQSKEKSDYISKIGSDRTVAIGNGKNDRLMVKNAKLGIAVLQDEGAFTETVLASDIVVKSIIDGLNLCLNCNALIATLRD